VETNAATSVAAEVDPAAEGIPHHLGHQSPATNFAFLEAPGTTISTARAILEADSKGAPRSAVSHYHHWSGYAELKAVEDLQRRRSRAVTQPRVSGNSGCRL